VIRLLVIWAVMLVTIIGSASAYQSRDSNYNKVITSSGGSYSGPMDAVTGQTISVCYALRGCSKSYSTGSNPAITVRRASDSTTSNINVLSNGNLDVATFNTFCAATTCFLTEIFDQSGANGCSGAPCNLTQATTVEQAQIVTSGCGLGTSTLPCIVGATNNWIFTSAGPAALSQPFTQSVVAERTANFTTEMTPFSTGGAAKQAIGFTTSANTAFVGELGLTSIITATAADSAWHSLIGVSNGASPNSILSVDGVSTTGTTVGITNVFTAMLAESNGVNALNGFMTEAIMWSTALSSANLTALCHNQYAYWGTSTSC
jgi:hypothetical protein